MSISDLKNDDYDRGWMKPNLTMEVTKIRKSATSSEDLGERLHNLWYTNAVDWELRDVYEEAIRQQTLSSESWEVYCDVNYE